MFHRESGVRVVIGTQHSNSLTAQVARVIAALRGGPRSTIELRRDFDVMMPAARVFQLRGMGFNILTQRTQEATDCGKLHSVARYILTGNLAGDLSF